MSRLTITRPDDWHVHLRDGDALPRTTADMARYFGRIIVMPNLTGDKLAKKIISIRNDIPVVLCTGYSEKFTRQNASEMGIQSFLMKPLVMRDLANTVRQALSAN